MTSPDVIIKSPKGELQAYSLSHLTTLDIDIRNDKSFIPWRVGFKLFNTQGEVYDEGFEIYDSESYSGIDAVNATIFGEVQKYDGSFKDHLMQQGFTIFKYSLLPHFF